MRNFLLGALAALLLLAAAAAWVWHYQPERLPQEWRRQNPNSRDYMPTLYRWRDAKGQIHLTDEPPQERPFETVRVAPHQNVLPSAPPPPAPVR